MLCWPSPGDAQNPWTKELDVASHTSLHYTNAYQSLFWNTHNLCTYIYQISCYFRYKATSLLKKKKVAKIYSFLIMRHHNRKLIKIMLCVTIYYDKWQHQGRFQKSLKSACQSEVESGGMNVSYITSSVCNLTHITKLVLAILSIS